MTHSEHELAAAAEPGELLLYRPFEGPGYDPARGVFVVDPDHELILVINYAWFDPAKREPVDAYMVSVFDSLCRDQHPGYVGGSIVIEVDEAWTMSAWRDEDSIVRFYRSSAHSKAIDAALASVFHTRPARLKVAARDVPLDWAHAKQLCSRLSADPNISRRGLHLDRPG